MQHNYRILKVVLLSAIITIENARVFVNMTFHRKANKWEKDNFEN